MNVLVVDVGGTHVKLLVTGQSEPRKFVSGPTLTAEQMVAGVKELARDDRPAAEPATTPMPSWEDFAFGRKGAMADLRRRHRLLLDNQIAAKGIPR